MSSSSLQLHAFAPLDGWAIVGVDGSLLLVRSPFRASDRVVITESACATLVAGGAFDAVERPFTDWDALISWLQAERVRNASPEQLQDAVKAAASVLRFTSRERAEEHIETARRLIAEGHPKGALRLLQALMSANVVAASSELLSRISGLQQTALAAAEHPSVVPIVTNAYPVAGRTLQSFEQICRRSGGLWAWGEREKAA